VCESLSGMNDPKWKVKFNSPKLRVPLINRKEELKYPKIALWNHGFNPFKEVP